MGKHERLLERDHLCVKLNVTGDGKPPTEFTILNAGETQTSKGPLLFDSIAAELVMARFQEHGQEQLPIDYDHGMLGFVSSAETSKAAGWFVPQVDAAGALIASDVQWTPKAAQAMRDREYRFFSPAIYKDEDDNRVTRLINLALTNLPATRNQEPLVAKDSIEETPSKRQSNPSQNRGHMKEILQLLGVANEAEAIVAIERKDSSVKLLLSEIGAEQLDAAIPKVQELKTSAEASVKLAEQVRQLEAEKSANEREQLIVKLNDEGKLPLSLHDWARSQTTESLQAFGAAAPIDPKRHNHEASGEGSTHLSESELLVCKQLGMTREQYVSARKLKAADDEKLRAELEGRVQ